MKSSASGFTLVELLVVIAILSILIGIVVVVIDPATHLGEAGDAVRLSDMKMIVGALEQYLTANGRYPSISADGCCDGWDQGPCGTNPFMGALETQGSMKKVPTDPAGGSGTGCYGYNYYRYGAGSYGCSSSKGAFYVLGVRDMQTSERPHPDSPGWNCPSRNWQNEFDWVIGGFESP